MYYLSSFIYKIVLLNVIEELKTFGISVDLPVTNFSFIDVHRKKYGHN